MRAVGVLSVALRTDCSLHHRLPVYAIAFVLTLLALCVCFLLFLPAAVQVVADAQLLVHTSGHTPLYSCQPASIAQYTASYNH